jgi:signal transduction histidine kinase/ActR/RegA family two-component response regulator
MQETVRSYSRFAYGALLAFVLVFVGESAHTAYHDRQVLLEANVQRAHTGALMMEDQLSQSIRLFESSLKALPDLAGRPLAQLSHQELTYYLRRLIISQPAVRSISALDATGKIVASTQEANLNVAVDLDSFNPHDIEKDRISPLRIGAAWKGQDFNAVHTVDVHQAGDINATYFIPVALRIGKDSQKLWVLASIDPDFFVDRFTRFIRPDTDHFELTRYDGVSLVSSDDGLSHNEFEMASALDRMQEQDDSADWLTSTRTAPGYPFTVTMRVNREGVLSEWEHRTWIQGAWTLLAIVVMGSVTLYLMRQLHRAELAEQQQRQDLASSRDKAEAATRAKSYFLSNMSHEIRTPMNGVIGMTQLALEEQLPQAAEKYVRHAHTAAVSLLGILNEILDFSKIEAGKLQVESIGFNLKQVVDEAMSIQQFAASNKHLDLRVEWDDDVDVWMKGDPLRISQIINNLVGNAIKFTHKGQVSLRLSRPRPLWLRMDVIDQGVGMTQAQLANLFKPFSQADTSTTRLFGGTGLGLAICQHLCERMGGHIGVNSEPNIGSTFSVDLPYQPFEAPAIITPTPAQPVTSVDFRGLRVLVVEDHALNRQLLQTLLQKVGVHTELAVHGQDAIEKLNADPQAYDLVLMDIQMPVMDGIAATQTLRADVRFSKLPIIAVTANALSDEQDICIKAGMQAYLVKPIDRTSLYETLTQWGVKSKRA